MNTCELRPGMSVSFLNGIDAIERGIVNGEPWVLWDGGKIQARVPVYCTTLGNSFDVAADNIVAVEATIGAGHSERV